MAEPVEGWRVPWQRAAIAAVLTPLALLALLALAGWGYTLAWKPDTWRAITPFPAPGLETKHVRATRDPDAPEAPPRPDAQLIAAKARVAAGLPDWRPINPDADCAAARSPSCLRQLLPAEGTR